MEETLKISTHSRISHFLAAMVALFALTVGAGAGFAAEIRPTLNKVFVYEGEDRIRLVALFDAPLKGATPAARVKNGGLSIFVGGVQGGKPYRRFALGKGGYERIDARQSKDGIWLSVLTKEGVSPLKKTPKVTMGKSSITVTLPVLKKVGALARRAAPIKAPLSATETFGRKRPGRAYGIRAPKRTQSSSKTTPESILNQVLSSSAKAAVSSAKTAALPNRAKRPPLDSGSGRQKKKTQLSKILEDAKKSGEKVGFLSSLPSEKASEKARLGSNVVNLTGIAMKFAGALGGVLLLILGIFFFFKKMAPAAVSRLGGSGAIVRTLHKSTLAPKKSLAVVEVAGEVLVLGISGQNIAMLTKIESEEALARVRSAGESNFVDHLTKMLQKNPKSAKGTEFLEKKTSAGGAAAGDQGLQGKGAAALEAYSKQTLAEGKAGRRAGSVSPKSRTAGAGSGKAASGRSAARLRNRLDRLAPQLGAGAVVS